GQVAAHGIIQADSVLIDEPEHQRGRERLRYAPDPESLARCRRRFPGGRHGAVTVVRNENDHPRGAGAGKLLRGNAGRGGCTRLVAWACSQGYGHHKTRRQRSPAAAVKTYAADPLGFIRRIGLPEHRLSPSCAVEGPRPPLGAITLDV